jgi:succinyl-diaminopimelate desuccinylase
MKNANIMINTVNLTQALIACPSVTPDDAGAQGVLKSALVPAGFTCHDLPFGEGSARIQNLFARFGSSGPHLCYAGHTDVVPPGDEAAWSHGAFNPHIENGILYGRGASDMKGSVAAFTCAAIAFIKKYPAFQGSISLLITGDEEGLAINGTEPVLRWMRDHNHVPDVALVGEPTNPATLGQEIKIGRRGSLSGTIRVSGVQGHVAYPHKADNPLPRLIKLLDALNAIHFDDGNDHFTPTNLEITTIDVGNKAGNIIPSSGTAQFNIRFNSLWSPQTLSETIIRALDSCNTAYDLDLHCGAESFLTIPGPWPALVQQSVQDITGFKPAMTTTGGTSDARFIKDYCAVVECGAVNASIHQINENAKISDLDDLTKIYTRVLERFFKV